MFVRVQLMQHVGMKASVTVTDASLTKRSVLTSLQKNVKQVQRKTSASEFMRSRLQTASCSRFKPCCLSTVSQASAEGFWGLAVRTAADRGTEEREGGSRWKLKPGLDSHRQREMREVREKQKSKERSEQGDKSVKYAVEEKTELNK